MEGIKIEPEFGACQYESQFLTLSHEMDQTEDILMSLRPLTEQYILYSSTHCFRAWKIQRDFDSFERPLLAEEQRPTPVESIEN